MYTGNQQDAILGIGIENVLPEVLVTAAKKKKVESVDTTPLYTTALRYFLSNNKEKDEIKKEEKQITRKIEESVLKQFLQRKKAALLQEREGTITPAEIFKLNSQGYDVEVDGQMHYAHGGEVTSYAGGGKTVDYTHDILPDGTPFVLATPDRQAEYILQVSLDPTVRSDNTRTAKPNVKVGEKKVQKAVDKEKLTPAAYAAKYSEPIYQGEITQGEEEKGIVGKTWDAINNPITTFSEAVNPSQQNNPLSVLEGFLPTPSNMYHAIIDPLKVIASGDTYTDLAKVGESIIQGNTLGTNESRTAALNTAENLLAVLPSILLSKLPKKGVKKIVEDIPGQRGLKYSNPEGVSDLVLGLQKELEAKGILDQQRTPDSNFKQNVRVGVKPWGYDIGAKLKGVLSMYYDNTNPNYASKKHIDKAYKYHQNYTKARNGTPLSREVFEKHYLNDTGLTKERSNRKAHKERFEQRYSPKHGDLIKNRYTTWDMYLGYPQKENPLYKISDLTTSKDDIVYTMDPKKGVTNRIQEEFKTITHNIKKGRTTKGWVDSSGVVTELGNNKYSVYGNDFNFGTMGGFRWNVEELPDGKFKFIAEDVWDLNPISRLPFLPKSIKDSDLGTKLGIGKPLNVKVGFLYDPTKDRILETFEDGGQVKKYPHGGPHDDYTHDVLPNGVPFIAAPVADQEAYIRDIERSKKHREDFEKARKQEEALKNLNEKMGNNLTERVDDNLRSNQVKNPSSEYGVNSEAYKTSTNKPLIEHANKKTTNAVRTLTGIDGTPFPGKEDTARYNALMAMIHRYGNDDLVINDSQVSPTMGDQIREMFRYSGMYNNNYITAKDDKTVIAELAHLIQDDLGRFSKERFIKDILSSPFNYKNLYSIEGTIEEEAHKKMEPFLFWEYMRRKENEGIKLTDPYLVETPEGFENRIKALKKKYNTIDYASGGLVRGGTKKVQEYQRWMNKTFGLNLAEDGAWGPKTQAAYEKFVVNNSQSSQSIDIIPKLSNDADNTYTIVPVAQTVAPSKMTMDTLPKDIPLINGVPVAYNNAEQVGYSLPEQVPTTGYPFPQFVVPSAVPVETVYNKKNIYDPFGIRYVSDYPGYEGTNMNDVKRNNQGIKLKSDKVYAYDAGTVTSVTDIGPYRAIIVSTPDGGYHVYNNLDNVNVKNGDKISKNTYLGESAYDEDSKVKGFEFRMATVQPTKLIYQNPYEAVFTDPTQYMKMYGGKVNKYPGGGKTKANTYNASIDETGGTTSSQPKTKDELDKVSKFLLGLIAETALDQVPGMIGDAYKVGKVGYELYNQGIIPSIVEGAKVPVPYYGDLLMNFLNNNPWYNSYDLDKKLFGSPSPRGPVDSDIRKSKKKNKA